MRSRRETPALSSFSQGVGSLMRLFQIYGSEAQGVTGSRVYQISVALTYFYSLIESPSIGYFGG